MQSYDVCDIVAVFPAATPHVGGALDYTKGVAWSDLTVGVPRETYPGEKRVSQTPGEREWL
jgi:hypothetical protein